jgi:hypothetical protein
LSLPPEQAQLFRDLVRGKDPARPGAHPMPRDRDRNFIFSDLGQAQLQQQQRRDQQAEPKPGLRKEVLWFPYDPQLRAKPDSARITRVLEHSRAIEAVISVAMDDTRLSGGYTLKGLSTKAAPAHVLLRGSRLPVHFQDPDGADPPTRFKHDAVKHPSLCYHCHQSRGPCDPLRNRHGDLPPKWKCPIFRAQYPDLKPPDPKAITLDQLIKRSGERGQRPNNRPRPRPTNRPSNRQSRTPN